MTGVYMRRPSRRITLRDVAREAGVSIKTVSRVVNQATAVRVEDAVEKLGYRPNELARGLKVQRSRTIGLVIADVSNPFTADTHGDEVLGKLVACATGGRRAPSDRRILFVPDVLFRFPAHFRAFAGLPAALFFGDEVLLELLYRAASLADEPAEIPGHAG